MLLPHTLLWILWVQLKRLPLRQGWYISAHRALHSSLRLVPLSSNKLILAARMSPMDQVKGWLLKKCSDAPKIQVNSYHLNNCPRSFCPIILTPQNIPEFTIPKAFENSDGSRSGSNPEVLLCSAESLPSSPCKTSLHRTQSFGKVSPLMCRNGSSVSAPVSPHSDLESRLKLGPQPASSEGLALLPNPTEQTNADPFSSAAMGLTHFKTKTSFGFDTLTERPHTHRKESLFHSENIKGLSLWTPNSKQLDRGSNSSEQSDLPQLFLNLPSHSSCSSCTNSPVQSPGESPSDLLMQADISQASSKANSGVCHLHMNTYYRRRSSLPDIHDGQCPLCPSENGQPGSTAKSRSLRTCDSDNSDQLERSDKSSSLLPPKNSLRLSRSLKLNKLGSEQMKLRRTHSDFAYSGPFLKAENNNCSWDVHSLSGVPATTGQHGEIKLSFQYLPESQRLKIVLIRAENLGVQSSETINPLIKLSLKPLKHSKLQTEVVHNKKNPTFNKEFYFTSLSLAQLKRATLKLKVYNKISNLKEDLIGEVLLPLKSFDLMTENRMWRNIIHRAVDEVNTSFTCYVEP